MRNFLTAFKNNTRKIFARKKYIVLLILFCLFAIALSLFSFTTKADIGFSAMTISFSNVPITILGLLSNFLLPLSSFMLMSDLVAHEISEHSIKAEFVRPVSRTTLYFSKCLAGLFYCAIILFSIFIITTFFALIQGNLMSVFKTLLAYIMVLAPCATVMILAAFVAALTANPTLSMFILLIGYGVLFVMSMFSTFWAAISFTTQISWYKFIFSSNVQWNQLLLSLSMFLGYSVFFGTLGQLSFNQRNM